MAGRFLLIAAGALFVLGLLVGSMAFLGVGIGFGTIFGIWAIRTGFGTASGRQIASDRLTSRVAEARRRQKWRRAREQDDE